MNAEFFEALEQLEKERGLPANYLVEKIANAIVIAVKKDYEVEDENVLVEIDPAKGRYDDMLLAFHDYVVGKESNPFDYDHEYAVQQTLDMAVGGIRILGKELEAK